MDIRVFFDILEKFREDFQKSDLMSNLNGLEKLAKNAVSSGRVIKTKDMKELEGKILGILTSKGFLNFDVVFYPAIEEFGLHWARREKLLERFSDISEQNITMSGYLQLIANLNKDLGDLSRKSANFTKNELVFSVKESKYANNLEHLAQDGRVVMYFTVCLSQDAQNLRNIGQEFLYIDKLFSVIEEVVYCKKTGVYVQFISTSEILIAVAIYCTLAIPILQIVKMFLDCVMRVYEIQEVRKKLKHIPDSSNIIGDLSERIANERQTQIDRAIEFLNSERFKNSDDKEADHELKEDKKIELKNLLSGLFVRLEKGMKVSVDKKNLPQAFLAGGKKDDEIDKNKKLIELIDVEQKEILLLCLPKENVLLIEDLSENDDQEIN